MPPENLNSASLSFTLSSFRVILISLFKNASSLKRFVIVEVKTRTTDYFGEPEMEVKPAKQRAIVRTAEAYILSTDFKGETRFDVIGILLGGGKVTLNHIKDAFMARM